MEAVASVTDRISQIQSRLAAITGSPARSSTAVLGTVVPTTSSSAAAGGPPPGFDDVLSAELGATGFAGVPLAATVLSPGSPVQGTAGPGVGVGPAGAVGAAGPAVGQVGAVGAAVGSGRSLVNAKGVPVELLTYGNGKVPAEALSPVAGVSGHRLWTPAARSLEALRAAAAADGVRIGVTDSYRPYETQVDLVRRKGLYSQGGLAAAPGTSNHGWGIALDLDLDAPAQRWMRANAGRFGFVEDVPREPWHWTYRPTS